MRKIKLLLLLISSFLFSHVNAIKFSGIEVPEGWNTASYKNSCDEIVVFVFDKSKKLNIYKIYLEEIPNNKEEVKIRIAYKFDRFFIDGYKWINFDEEILIAKKDLTVDFEIGLKILPKGNPEMVLGINEENVVERH